MSGGGGRQVMALVHSWSTHTRMLAGAWTHVHTHAHAHANAHPQVMALVHSHARAGLLRQLSTVCNEVLRKRPQDMLLKFWRAYAMLMEGSTAEVREHVHVCACVRACAC